MKQRGRIKIFVSYALILIFVASLIVLPDYALGKDNLKNMVAIKTFNGMYLCAENGGGDELKADRDNAREWETFEIIDLGKEYIALKGYNGDYVSVSNDKNGVFVNGKEIGKRQSFKLVSLGSNKVALMAYNNNYICAEGGGGGKVVADRKKIGNWETFEFIKVLESNSDKCNLTATADDKGVTFTWNKPSNVKNIIGYNIYRGTSPGKQSATPITDFPIEGTSYTDKNIESGTKYYYVLRVVYKDKTEGTISNELVVQLKAKPIKRNIILEVGSKYMYINGKKMEIDPGKGTIMIINNGRTFLPIRAVIEAMGGEVEWSASDKRVSIYLKDSKIHLWIGNKMVKVNGSTKESDVAPYISDKGRTMLPLRFIAENLDCQVDWDGLTKKVTIKIDN